MLIGGKICLDNATYVESCAKAAAVVYAGTHNHSKHDCHSHVVPNLHQLATNLQKMTPQQRDDEAETPDRPDRSCVRGVHDPLAGPRHCHTALVVVVDEVSMFSAQNLSQLDQRLRQLYDPSRVFGGISILLVGDFLQLRVIGGVDLYKVMYVARHAVEVRVQDLFRRFRVFEMHTLIRAHGCALHQQRLCALPPNGGCVKLLSYFAKITCFKS